MNGYLLDTCTVSENMSKKPNKQVKQWLDSQKEQDLFISLLSLGEIKKGIIKVQESQPQRYKRLAIWFKELELRFDSRILLVDKPIIDCWSEVCEKSEAQGRRLPVIDSLIAATALVHNLTVVTRNVSDFSYFPVELLNPWDFAKE